MCAMQAKDKKEERSRRRATLYDNVTQQFDQAADLMKLDPDIRRILSRTANEIVVHFPVKMDDGTTTVFTGYRVQHSIARGPGKGGTGNGASERPALKPEEKVGPQSEDLDDSMPSERTDET